MGQRPSKENWHYTGWCDEEYGKAWDEGNLARKNGLTEDYNPYKSSNHERDTTYEDELHYWWYSGFNSIGEN